MLALWPRPQRYFRDGWNIFDFLIIVLRPGAGHRPVCHDRAAGPPAAGGAPDLGHPATCASSWRRWYAPSPAWGHVIMLMSIVAYIYAIMGHALFHEQDPAHWGTLGRALLTLFNLTTLDNWVQIMNTAMEYSLVGVGVLREFRCDRNIRCH